jgi:hypothetical protein
LVEVAKQQKTSLINEAKKQGDFLVQQADEKKF